MARDRGRGSKRDDEGGGRDKPDGGGGGQPQGDQRKERQKPIDWTAGGKPKIVEEGGEKKLQCAVVVTNDGKPYQRCDLTLYINDQRRDNTNRTGPDGRATYLVLLTGLLTQPELCVEVQAVGATGVAFSVSEIVPNPQPEKPAAHGKPMVMWKVVGKVLGTATATGKPLTAVTLILQHFDENKNPAAAVVHVLAGHCTQRIEINNTGVSNSVQVTLDAPVTLQFLVEGKQDVEVVPAPTAIEPLPVPKPRPSRWREILNNVLEALSGGPEGGHS